MFIEKENNIFKYYKDKTYIIEQDNKLVEMNIIEISFNAKYAKVTFDKNPEVKIIELSNLTVKDFFVKVNNSYYENQPYKRVDYELQELFKKNKPHTKNYNFPHEYSYSFTCTDFNMDRD